MKTIDELLGEVAAKLNVHQPVSEEKGKSEAVKPAESALPKASENPQSCDKMTLKTAKALAQAVEYAAEKIGVSVVTAVVNDGARLVCLEAMDNSYIASVNAAQDKAYTAAALKMPTYTALEQSRGGALDGFTNGNGILMLAGGEPLMCGERLIGGVGVSGGTKEQDALLARVAAEVFKAL